MATNVASKFQGHWQKQYKGDFEIQFSERLLCLLYYHTDVGLIPRSKGRPDISPASSQCSKFNFKKAIEGCYWCSEVTTSHQAICCSSGCLVLFHEWCVCKVNKTRFNICKYPGCASDEITTPTECCKVHEAEYSNRYGIIQSNKNLQDPKWYFVKLEDHRIQSSQNDSISMGNEMDFAMTDVTMTGAGSSLFIFSKSLYEELIYRTDVGPIPRDSFREEHLSSEFTDSPNWRVAIEGCYWCGRTTRTNQYTYVCNKKCYSLFHEWCRRKVYEFCGDSICMYPGCEKPAVENANCCSETHQHNLEEDYKSIKKAKSTDLGTGAYWYQKKGSNSNRKITQFFLRDSPTKLSQQQQLPFVLNDTLTQHIMTLTDIGPVPRELLTNPNFIQSSQSYLQTFSNWNTNITGCYWCCTPVDMVSFLYIFCNKKCFYLFNEWCFQKLKELAPTINCCKYISCPQPSNDPSTQCCKNHALPYLSEYGEFSHLLKTTGFILGPRWYNNSTALRTVEFYNRDEPFYEFTNFFVCSSLHIDNISYPTSEHYFQSQKFVGTPYPRYIAGMSHPRESFDFSRSSRGTHWIRPDWPEVKEQVMYKVLKEKFTQNPELGYLLISTCNAVILEHTSKDSYWGDAGDGTGKNRLGVLLMRLRMELQSENTYFPDTLTHHTYEELCCKFITNLTSPLTPATQSQSNSLSPVDFNLLSIKSSLNNSSSSNSFKQIRNSDNEWITDEDNVNSSPASVGEHNSTNSTHGGFVKPVDVINSSEQSSDRPPPFNPSFPPNPAVSVPEGHGADANRGLTADNSVSMET